MVRSKSLKCTHCGRMFGMPAHLGRHMKAVHGVGKSRGAGRKLGRPRGRSTGAVLANGFGQVEAQLQRARDALVVQRETIDSQIAKLGEVLQALA
jgi:hypothetical protein